MLHFHLFKFCGTLCAICADIEMGETWLWNQAFRTRVLEVTQEDVNRVAQKYLVEGMNASSMAIVGNQVNKYPHHIPAGHFLK